MALLAIVVLTVLICCEVYAAGNTEHNATTNAERINYIKKLGYILNSNEPTQKNVIIPEIFTDVYKNYNSLQRMAGYDLSLYKGCEVKIYTYDIAPPKGYDGECVFNMIVYRDRMIGGDVSSRALGGYMLPISEN